jgi:hypothetical protein
MKGVARDFMQLRLNRGQARHERWLKGRHRQKKCDNEIDAFRSPRHTMASENSLKDEDFAERRSPRAHSGHRTIANSPTGYYILSAQ